MNTGTGADLAPRDRTLDADLADWHAATGRPRVRLLGTITVDRTAGDAPRRNTARLTDLAAYLACHPEGVTREDLGRDVFPPGSSDAAQRNLVAELRRWFGTDAQDGAYLPRVVDPQDRYTLRGVLLDAQLFRRLRLRGLTRGAAGIEDLWAALTLVTGEPLNHAALGYGWLADDPIWLTYPAMAADTAHLLASHHLAAGERGRAIDAATAGLLAGGDDQLMLDLIAAHDAQGRPSKAPAVIGRLLAQHEAQVEEDLPPAVLRAIRRRYTARAGIERWLRKYRRRLTATKRWPRRAGP